MLSAPRFSVVIPCHNAGATIHETLASVCAQTWPDWEAVVIDDGSTDDSAAVVENLGQRDTRIRLQRHPNGGVSTARNRGAAAARGQILVFLDADDTLYPHTLSVLDLAFDACPDAIGAIGRVAFLDPDGKASGRHSALPPPTLKPTAVMGENPACTGSNLSIRREAFSVVGGFDANLRHAEDQEWLLRVTAAGPVLGLPEILVGYRLSPNGAHADLPAMERGWEHMIDTATRSLPKQVLRHRPAAKARHLRMLARRALRNPDQAAEALPYIRRAIVLDPALLIDARRTLATVIIAVVARVPGQTSRRLVARLAR